MKKREALLALTITSVLFGVNYSVAKGLMPHFVSPPQLMIFRLSGTLLVLLPWYWMRGAERVAPSDRLRMILSGLTGITLNQVFFFEGLSRTSPVDASIIHTLSPMMVMVFALILIGERLTWRKVAGMAIGGAGALWLVVLAGQSATVAGTLTGNLLILLNIACYSLYLVVVKPLMARYSALTVMTHTFAWGSLFVLPYVAGSFPSLTFSHFTTGAWLALLYVVFLTTLTAFSLTAWALQHVSATAAGYFIYLQPVIASLVAWMAYGETLTASKLSAALLVFSGVFLVIYKPKAGAAKVLTSTRENG